MLCPAADSHLKLLHRVVRSAGFLDSGVFECKLAHRRSEAVLCYLILSINPLSGALSLLYVPSPCGAFVAHMHSFPPPPRKTSQYSRTFVPPSPFV